MIFTSLEFLLFLSLVIAASFTLPAKYRWLVLLLANIVFYINTKPIYLLLLMVVSTTTYFSAKFIDKANTDSDRKNILTIGIIFLLLPLFFFKYFSAINSGILSVLQSTSIYWPIPEIKYLLPVGISFYTFMAIGYLIDVYNDDIKAENNLGILSVFLSFFPLILSGPIERANNILPQLHQPKSFKFDSMVQGLKFVVWGYFMKLVIADRIGIYVDTIYNNLEYHNGTSLFFASMLYPIQLYADLGGYSLIAIGVAKILGINVIQNFKRPFFALSMADLWRRWHTSLITWLTDYVYTPLSFSFRRLGIFGIVLALMITFLISGIWHGAAWTFVVWGLLQGTFLSVEALSNSWKQKFVKKLKLKTNMFYILVSCAFTYILFASSQVFGRVTSVSDAFLVFERILKTPGKLFIGEYSTLIHIFIGVVILFIKDIIEELNLFKPSIEKSHWVLHQIFYAFLITLILLMGVFDGGQFIYFQF